MPVYGYIYHGELVPQLPVISIIGRPNVGKSSLFNRIVGKRVAVVDDFSGITRDRNYMETEWNGIRCIVVDTGGLLPTADEPIPTEINKQVDIAMHESDAVIFLVDAQTPPTDYDLLIARKVRRTLHGKILLAANKAEKESVLYEVDHYLELGLGEVHPISALHGNGVGDLLDCAFAVAEKNRHPRESLFSGDAVKLAIVGRPNAGKSSLVNSLLKEERMIVDTVAGTTRDAVDSLVAYRQKELVIIDTAGLRRKAQVKNNVEYYANLRALESIKRCDVAVLIIDVLNKIGEQDLKILGKIHEARKGAVVCLNKWDALPKDTRTFDQLAAEAKRQNMDIRHIPILSISALTGQRVHKIFDHALAIHERMHYKVTAAELKNLVFDWCREHPHPIVSNKEVRILGGKQRQADFPLFFIYATNAQKAQPGYIRYLTNKIYGHWNFEGCPVVVEFKQASRPRFDSDE
ncbi:MAG: ribosome biogenesis GTPase Der [Chitinivibrionales bacterium]|nr:ribosome biogenesis GTPase Der [Chitinivibrionales bacterium]